MGRRSRALLVLGLAACAADEAREPAVLGEVCGVEGPFRLIELAPSQRVVGGLQPVGDRFWYVVEDEGAAVPNYALWSVGPCGEAPTRIADDVSRLRAFAPWPDLLLGCREQAHDIVSLDPTGAQPPHVVFADIDCGAAATAHGLVTYGDDDAPAPLMLHPFPDDPHSETSEPVVLLDPLPVVDPTVVRLSTPRVRDDEVLLLDGDNALLRVDLADGEVTVEQTDVREFEVSFDSRYLIWQTMATSNSDPQRPEGAVLLRDRTTDEGGSLAQTWLRYSGFPLGWVDEGYVELVLRNGETGLFTLPGLALVTLPRNVRLRGRLPDGRWLVAGGIGGPIGLSDLGDGEEITPLWAGDEIVRITSDHMLIQDVPPCCIGEDYFRDEGPIWFVPFDGSEPRRLSEAVARFPAFIDERRMIATVDVDAQQRGTLVLVDLETRDEQLIDEQVQYAFGSLGSLDVGRAWYAVRDGERSGVWVIRLPG